MKKALVIMVNTLLVLIILGTILATWMPAIYSSSWFQSNRWIRIHLLHDDTAEKLPQMKTDGHR